MPTSIVTVILVWLASHLVTMTLLAFLLVGLALFGVIDLTPRGGSAGPDTSSTREAETVEPQSGVSPVPSQPASAAQPVELEPPARRDESRQTPPSDPAPSPPETTPRQGPRMIGGNIPVYGIPVPGQVRPSPDGFRPPYADAGDAMPAARDDLLQRARRAFWNGDFEQAEVGYMDLIEAYPDAPEAFGELGNVYEAMGRSAKALDAFYEAAVRHRAQGDKAQLDQLIEVLRRHADSRVEELAY